ncbi:hypothetical protein Len3610_08440 [Lentibacillus sp. CBA3610]|nr:hypothetical protein Len3610_08440 [Lentibacillus sp. CBA3610]
MIGVEGRRLLREKHVSRPEQRRFSATEAEAVPAESDCPKRKSTKHSMSQFIDFLSKTVALK